MDLNNNILPSSSDQSVRSGFFATSPTRSPVRAYAPIITSTGMAIADGEMSPRRDVAASSSLLQHIPSSSARRMVPRNELELSRPAIARAEKDGDDPSSSSSRRRLPNRGHSSTPVTLTRLFAVQAPSSPPPSRVASFYKRSQTAPSNAKSPASEDDALPLHLYVRGLLDGKYSDIKINVLGKSYALHRIVLDQAPFFASALSEPWLESTAKEVTLHPELLDPSITTTSFELALKRLYGCPDFAEEAREPLNMFATGCWLEMKELVEASVEVLLMQIRPRILGSIINVVTTNYYGKGGNRVLSTCKSMLSREGWLMPMRYWDDIPSEVVRDVIGADSFFVYSEWRRWLFVKRLVNRRLKAIANDLGLLSDSQESIPRAPSLIRIRAPRNLSTGDIPVDEEGAAWVSLYEHSEITPLFELLDRGIYYMHLDFEQLQHVRSTVDVFGVPLVPEQIISTALWDCLELRQKVMNARNHDDLLGLSQSADFASSSSPSDVPSEYDAVLSTRDQGLKNSSQYTLPIQTTAEGQETKETSSSNVAKPEHGIRRFWVPTVDCNVVTGGTEPVVTLSSTTTDRSARPLKSRQTSNNGDSETLPSSYTRYPPFRFAAELPHPRSIKDDKRIYSRTIFYAGSLWNLYVQKKRSGAGKSPQVGVYLHRAKEQGPEDTGYHYGSVDERIGALEREMLLRSHSRPRRSLSGRDGEFFDLGIPSTGDTETSLLSSFTQSQSTASPLSNFMTGTKQRSPKAPQTEDPTTAFDEDADDSAGSSSDEDNHSTEDYLQNLPNVGGATLPPYLDTRPIVQTYYRIYCPAKGGRMLSVYESAPDSFKFSQSCGWKCNSLMLDDEGMAGNGSGGGSADGVNGEKNGGVEVSAADLEEGQACEWVVGSSDGGAGGSAEGAKRRIRRMDGRLRLTVVLGVI